MDDGNGGKTTAQIPNLRAQTFHQRDREAPGQLPVGWHHEWSPGNHTPLLVGRLAARQEFRADSVAVPVATTDVAALATPGWDIEVGDTIPRAAALFSALRPRLGRGELFSHNPATLDLDYP